MLVVAHLHRRCASCTAPWGGRWSSNRSARLSRRAARAVKEAMRLRTKLTGYSFRPRLPRRTIRVRFAVLFFAVFLASGAALLAVTVAVWLGRTAGEHTAQAPAGSLLHPAIGVTQHSSDRHQLLIAAGIALAIMAVLSLAIGWLRGRAVPAAAAHDHDHRPGDLGHQPARAPEPRRPRRRAQGARRHLR